MLVTDIEFSDYTYCRQSLRHQGTVCMILKNQAVTLFCRLDLPQDEDPKSRAAAFVAEATRQLLRMPEYRSGRQKLEVADGLVEGARRQMA